MLADFAGVVGPLAGGLYLIASLLLVAYVANGYVLLARCLWTRERSERECGQLLAEGRKILAIKSGEGTAVVTQLPLYNEATVAERVIRAAAAIEWPHTRQCARRVQMRERSKDSVLSALIGQAGMAATGRLRRCRRCGSPRSSRRLFPRR